jgi:hypothetical protein
MRHFDIRLARVIASSATNQRPLFHESVDHGDSQSKNQGTT